MKKLMVLLRGLLFWIGFYLIFDGIISIIHFKDATFIESASRVFRSILGVVVVIYSIKWMKK